MKQVLAVIEWWGLDTEFDRVREVIQIKPPSAAHTTVIRELLSPSWAFPREWHECTIGLITHKMVDVMEEQNKKAERSSENIHQIIHRESSYCTYPQVKFSRQDVERQKQLASLEMDSVSPENVALV